MIKYLKSLISAPLLFGGSANANPKLRLQTDTEFTNVALPVHGNIPLWLKGKLIRNCAVPVYESGKEKTHFFDGVAMLHSFNINEGNVTYSSRYLQSEAYLNVVQSDLEFYQCDIDSEKAKTIQDAAVNLFKFNKDYVALTETPLPVRFDVENLETLGSFEYQDNLPKKKIFETAHPHYYEDSKEIFNFLIEYGMPSHYVIYKMEENSSARKEIARIPTSKPGYMHSFAMTEKYIVLAEYPFLLSIMRLMVAKLDSFASFIKLFDWTPEQGTRFFVVEKSTGKLVLETKSETLFSFHHANAYEQADEIIIDLLANNFGKLGHIFPASQGASETTKGLLRFKLSLKDKNLKMEKVLDQNLEFPRIPSHLDGKAYHYLYMVNFDSKEHSFLVKHDWKEGTQTHWKAEKGSVIEPVFVPAPNATKEDEGVLLSVVRDETAKSSYLIILNAEDLQEIARAELPDVLPNTFHGQFF